MDTSVGMKVCSEVCPETMILFFLQTLPKGISALRSLRVLDLEGNRLEYLATEISEE